MTLRFLLSEVSLPSGFKEIPKSRLLFCDEWHILTSEFVVVMAGALILVLFGCNIMICLSDSVKAAVATPDYFLVVLAVNHYN